MSRSFDATLSQYLEHAGAVVTATPLTMACWFNIAAIGTAYTLMGVFDNTSTTRLFRLQISITGVIGFAAGDTTINTASTTSAASINTWNHVCGVSISTTSRASYLNGANKGTNTTSRTPTGLNVTAIGRGSLATPTNYMTGLIGEVSIWNTALTDDEVLILANGTLPSKVHPESLVAYWPLRGLGAIELNTNILTLGQYNMTVNGATSDSSNPPVGSTDGKSY